MVINHNLNAMNAHRNMNSSVINQGKSMEKLSSGLRINRAGDDAAGLAISEKMRSQIRGLNQASRNVQDGISLIQTAEGALSEVHSIFRRMRELAIQSSNGTYTDDDKILINQEFEQLKSEIDRVANDTESSGRKILDGSISGIRIDGQDFKDLIKPGGMNGNLDHIHATPQELAKLGSGRKILDGSISGIRIDGQDFKDLIKPGGMNGNLDHIHATPQELAKLGRGEFVFAVSSNSYIQEDVVTLSIIDNTFEEPYVIDKITFDNLATESNPLMLEVAGITVKVNGKLTQLADGIIINNTPEFLDDGLKLQVGANRDQIIGFSIDNMKSREFGPRGMDVLNVENSQQSLGVLDHTIEKVSEQRSRLGAVQNRLEHTMDLNNNSSKNLQAAESRIRDVDMAKEMMNLTKLNVLQQASQSMVAQANQAPQQIMQLLK